MTAPPVVVLSKLPEPIVAMAKVVEVACCREEFPSTVSPPLALSTPPTFSTAETVEEPVTARAVEVAPCAVKPPLNARRVVVAFPGNG